MRKSGVALLTVGLALSAGLAFTAPRSDASSSKSKSPPTTTSTFTDGGVHPRNTHGDDLPPLAPTRHVVSGQAHVLVNTFAPMLSAHRLAYAGVDSHVDDRPGALSRLQGTRTVDAQPRPRRGAARWSRTTARDIQFGFYEADSAAGFYANNTLYYPMVDGLATVVRYTNGTVNITKWTGGPRPGPTVLMARQNLSLLVNNYRETGQSLNNQLWGSTLGGVPAVWRSALGLDNTGQPHLRRGARSDVVVTRADHGAAARGSSNAVGHQSEWPIFVTYANRGASERRST